MRRGGGHTDKRSRHRLFPFIIEICHYYAASLMVGWVLNEIDGAIAVFSVALFLVEEEFPLTCGDDFSGVAICHFDPDVAMRG